MSFVDREAVAYSILNEGAGHFVLDYTSADEMPDDELRQAFEAAALALKQFMDLLPAVEGF